MAQASIQITQGAIVGGSGQSVIGFDTTTDVTLTDDGGAGATSYQWEFVSYPAPLASPPTINNDTSQVANITDTLLDGVYVLRLTRVDVVDGTTTDVRFFAVADADGFSLPSSAMNRNMCNVGGLVAAQEAGWFGSTAAGTDVFLDGYLRDLKAKVNPSIPTTPGENDRIPFADNGKLTFATGVTVVDPGGTQDGLVLTQLVSTGDLTYKAAIGQAHIFQVNTVELARFSGLGLSFHGATPVVQATDPGALTDATGGVVDGTLTAVVGTPDDTNINNNFADLSDKVNKLRAIVSAGAGGVGLST